LPHADISGNFQDNLKLQTSLIPDFINGNLDNKIPVQFGTKYTLPMVIRSWPNWRPKEKSSKNQATCPSKTDHLFQVKK
jgi:hypothetical protein